MLPDDDLSLFCRYKIELSQYPLRISFPLPEGSTIGSFPCQSRLFSLFSLAGGAGIMHLK